MGPSRKKTTLVGSLGKVRTKNHSKAAATFAAQGFELQIRAHIPGKTLKPKPELRPQTLNPGP